MKNRISGLNHDELGKLFAAKEEFHREMAKLPFENKIEIVVKLQKLANEARASAGDNKTNRRVWELKNSG